MKKVLIGLFVLSLVWAVAVEAAIPEKINIQGVIDPRPAEGKTINFAIFDAASGGIKLLEANLNIVHTPPGSSIKIVIDELGYFNLVLPVSGIDFDKPLYLEITIDGSIKLEPRQALLAAPYAISAKNLWGGMVSAETEKGVAVTGIAHVGTGTQNFGGAFFTESVNGAGVAGLATATGPGPNMGGSFMALGDQGMGVVSWGKSLGGWFNTENGIGVLAQSTTGLGVFAKSNSYPIWAEGPKNYFSGKVGIGTIYPASKLSIYSLVADGAGTAADGITFGNPDQIIGWTHAGIWSDGSSGWNGDLVFGTDGDGTKNSNIDERMRITHDGKVGIGTKIPESELHVRSGYSNLILDSTGSPGTKWSIYARPQNQTLYFQERAPSSGDRMVIKSGGNVGIGTTAPTAKLDVVASGGPALRIKDGMIIIDSDAVGFVQFVLNQHSVTVTNSYVHSGSLILLTQQSNSAAIVPAESFMVRDKKNGQFKIYRSPIATTPTIGYLIIN